jgi:hypothetical protein
VAPISKNSLKSVLKETRLFFWKKYTTQSVAIGSDMYQPLQDAVTQSMTHHYAMVCPYQAMNFLLSPFASTVAIALN